MSVREELKVKQSSGEDGDEATTIPLEVILHQSEFFDKLKQFLLSQQDSLRQNLDTVREKTGKSSTTTTTTRTQVNRETSKESGASIIPRVDPSAHASSSEPPPPHVLKQKNEIQVCPICGMEFEGGTGDALETHVAEHWCSSSEFSRGLSN